MGEEALSDKDKRLLKFAESFEQRFTAQGSREDRSIEKTLDIGWELVSALPEEELTRISPELKKKHYTKK